MVQSPAPLPDSSSPSTWSPFVFAVIGVICTIFLVLSYYKILKRHCLTRGSSMLRSRSDRQLFNEANPDDPSLQFHSRGLDSAIIYCLPTIQYRNKSDDETDKNNKECSVCLGEFEDGDWLRLLPNCTHSFHIACIDTWFESHSNCPLCRSHIIYDLTDHHAVSMLTLLETLRREDVIRETTGSSQVVHFESMRIMRAQQSPN